MEIFSEIGPRNIFLVPPNSAPGLRPCLRDLSQPALLNHHPVSPFLDPRSLLISCFPTEPYISITAPRLWNDLPPELRTISLPPPPSLPIARHHLHLPPLSVTPRTFHSKLKSHLFNLSY